VGKVDSLLISCCLSDENDPDGVITFSVDHDNNTPLQEAKRDKTLLIIGQPIILHRDRVPIKHRLNAEEINAVLSEIGQALVFISCKTHGHCKNFLPERQALSADCTSIQRCLSVIWTRLITFSCFPTTAGFNARNVHNFRRRLRKC
jgi:hypothetical protein